MSDETINVLNKQLAEKAAREIEEEIAKLFQDMKEQFGPRLQAIASTFNYDTGNGYAFWQDLWYAIESRTQHQRGSLIWNTHTVPRPDKAKVQAQLKTWVLKRQKKLTNDLLKAIQKEGKVNKGEVTVRGRIVEDREGE